MAWFTTRTAGRSRPVATTPPSGTVRRGPPARGSRRSSGGRRSLSLSFLIALAFPPRGGKACGHPSNFQERLSETLRRTLYMKTRIRASQYSFLTLLPVFMVMSGSLRAQGPSINSLTFTPVSINTAGVSANVTVNFNLTGQGVYYFATAFMDPSGNYVGHQVDKSFAPSNSVTDSVTISFPPFSAPGTWSIAYVF